MPNHNRLKRGSAYYSELHKAKEQLRSVVEREEMQVRKIKALNNTIRQQALKIALIEKELNEVKFNTK